ncbi:hypothetical protein CLAIMM_06720, partial [Cladophialophora immunda]
MEGRTIAPDHCRHIQHIHRPHRVPKDNIPAHQPGNLRMGKSLLDVAVNHSREDGRSGTAVFPRQIMPVQIACRPPNGLAQPSTSQSQDTLSSFGKSRAVNGLVQCGVEGEKDHEQVAGQVRSGSSRHMLHFAGGTRLEVLTLTTTDYPIASASTKLYHQYHPHYLLCTLRNTQ